MTRGKLCVLPGTARDLAVVTMDDREAVRAARAGDERVGRDIAVVGTRHMREETYHLLAHALGGVVAARLTGNGVGPLAPVASNDSDAGRAKNRRVELVQQ